MSIRGPATTTSPSALIDHRSGGTRHGARHRTRPHRIPPARPGDLGRHRTGRHHRPELEPQGGCRGLDQGLPACVPHRRRAAEPPSTGTCRPPVVWPDRGALASDGGLAARPRRLRRTGDHRGDHGARGHVPILRGPHDPRQHSLGGGRPRPHGPVAAHLGGTDDHRPGTGGQPTGAGERHGQRAAQAARDGPGTPATPSPAAWPGLTAARSGARRPTQRWAPHPSRT